MNPFHFLVTIHRGLNSRFRNIWYRSLGVQIQGYAGLSCISIPRQWADITLEGGVSLDDGVILLCSGPAKAGKLVIRQGTYVNRHTMFDVHEHLEIGQNCMIGPYCYLTDGNHGMTLGPAIKNQPIASKPVVIEDDVWLGARVVILSGVRVGKGAVVGAGAVVTRDVAPNMVVAGVPAKCIGERK